MLEVKNHNDILCAYTFEVCMDNALAVQIFQTSRYI